MEEVELKSAPPEEREAEPVETAEAQATDTGEPAETQVGAADPDEPQAEDEQPSQTHAGETLEPVEAQADFAQGTDTQEPAGTQTADAQEPAAATLPFEAAPEPEPVDESALKSVIEAIIYVTEEPVTPAQIAVVLGQPEEAVSRVLAELASDFAAPHHGIAIREIAGGFKMATKPEHHEALRAFAKSLKPALKLSLAALETLATIAYKQPITAPEIMEIRGVQGAGVLKTLLDRKLIQTGGRKNVVGRPILYRTTKEFLVQFGLKDLSELPTLKEFEELRRLATEDEEPVESAGPVKPAAAADAPASPEPASDAPAEAAETAGPEGSSEAPAVGVDAAVAEPVGEAAEGASTETAEVVEEPTGTEATAADDAEVLEEVAEAAPVSEPVGDTEPPKGDNNAQDA